MQKRNLLVVLILMVLFSICYMGCGGQDPVAAKQEEEPGEPPGPPPPPPPPPEAPGRSGAQQLADSVSSDAAFERIARDVLSGKYGSALQRILADEVSTCLNQMSEEGAVVILLSEESEQGATIQYGENGLIMFDISYIGGKIERGEFGDDASLVLRRLAGPLQK